MSSPPNHSNLIALRQAPSPGRVNREATYKDPSVESRLRHSPVRGAEAALSDRLMVGLDPSGRSQLSSSLWLNGRDAKTLVGIQISSLLLQYYRTLYSSITLITKASSFETVAYCLLLLWVVSFRFSNDNGGS